MRRLRTFSDPSELRQLDSLFSHQCLSRSAAASRAHSRFVGAGLFPAPGLAFGTCRRASTTFRVALGLVFRSFRQIRPDRIGGRDGLHRNLKQNERHAREGLGFSWSGTNAA